jgi:hypothetical protein
MVPMRDLRTIDRLMQAAAACETESAREACVVGAIVRCFADTGHFKPDWVAHFVPASMEYFASDIAEGIEDIDVYDPATGDRRTETRHGEHVNALRPSKAEIRAALKKLMDRYDPPRGVPAPI